MKLTVEHVAKICHEANRAYCEAIGDNTQKPWIEADEWQRASAVQGVHWRLKNITAPASAQHEAWRLDKVKDGWKYGEVKDAEKKEHPCMVPYAKLPPEQRYKDSLFMGIVLALKPMIG